MVHCIDFKKVDGRVSAHLRKRCSSGHISNWVVTVLLDAFEDIEVPVGEIKNTSVGCIDEVFKISKANYLRNKLWIAIGKTQLILALSEKGDNEKRRVMEELAIIISSFN